MNQFLSRVSLIVLLSLSSCDSSDPGGDSGMPADTGPAEPQDSGVEPPADAGSCLPPGAECVNILDCCSRMCRVTADVNECQ